MIPEEMPSRYRNPYEPPSAALDVQPGEFRLPDDGRPGYRGTLWFVRIVGILHLVYGLGALFTPTYYLHTLSLVLRGTHSAPWLLSPVQIVAALYWAAISALSFAAAYGLLWRKRWARGVVVAFLVFYFSAITMGNMIAAISEPLPLAIAGTLFGIACVIPSVVLALSSKCASVLSGLHDAPPETVAPDEKEVG